MSGRTRAFSGVVLVLVVAWSILYAVSAFMIRPQMHSLEQKNAEENSARVIDAINNSIETLKVSNQDWSSWDSTYRFVQDHNAAFAEENLQDSALQNLDVNFIIIYNGNGDTVFGKGLASNGTTLNVPNIFTTSFGKGGKLAAVSNDNSQSGILTSDGIAYLFASGPILKSDGSGPTKGTFVFAKVIDSSYTKQLSSQTELPISVLTTNVASIPAITPKDKIALETGKTVTVRVSSQTNRTYRILLDAYGKQSIIVQVDVSRELIYEAIKGLDTYLFVAGIIALGFTLSNGHFVGIALKRQHTIELKDEFFSIASHELRTPLTAIKGNSQLAIQIYGKDEDLRQMLDDIHTASERLIRIVTNFLDAARLEQGRLPFTIGVVDANIVVREVVEELQGLAIEKKLYIHADVSPHLDAVYADKDRLKQVISNLIGNAVKYTDEGGVTVTAREDKSSVIISVNDTGRGISETGKKALFRKFRQTRSDDSSKGSGLGLYIARMLVQKMGGTIWLESSELDHGTTISFSVPIAKGDTPVQKS